jgi:hypothetical protein
MDNKLLKLAADNCCLSESLVLAQALQPEWNRSYPKWLSYVPCGLRDIWGDLPLEARLAVIATASVSANLYEPLD